MPKNGLKREDSTALYMKSQKDLRDKVEQWFISITNGLEPQLKTRMKRLNGRWVALRNSLHRAITNIVKLWNFHVKFFLKGYPYPRENSRNISMNSQALNDMGSIKMEAQQLKSVSYKSQGSPLSQYDSYR